MNAAARGKSRDSLRWLSQDYLALRREAAAGTRWDVLVVGSGYGGAMAAAEFAGLQESGRDLRVAVLERGREYVPGMFASSLQELPPHLRVHRAGHARTFGARDALLDVRLGPDVCTILGNGLGGGSLVNAGVMEKPRLAAGEFPPALQADLSDERFEAVKQALGATATLSQDHPGLAGELLPKTAALRRVAQMAEGTSFRAAAITVQAANAAGHHAACALCGDCMTGCNVGAKKSLDTTLLVQASSAGARIYTGGSVLRVLPDPDAQGWLVETVFTDASLRQRHAPVRVRARKVVLAAGTLGSTEILLRSRSDALPLSKRLGAGFSCNGDNLVAVHGGPLAVHSTARESEPLAFRRVGPTITGVVQAEDFLLQEFAVPAALKRLFDETVTTARLLNTLASWPARTPAQQSLGLDSMAVDPVAMENTLLVGIIGHDESEGEIVPSAQAEEEEEGQVQIRWPQVRRSPRMQTAFEQAQRMLEKALPGAKVLPNPAWRLLPAGMEFLAGDRGPVLTVHPLGGCGMGSSHHDGVVDELGRVFKPTAQGSAFHEGLVVLDGSVLPRSLGANPALTIATIAQRAARALAAAWGWQAAAAPQLVAPGARPVYRDPAHCTPAEPRPTEVEMVERLAGPAHRWWVELTLCYERTRLADLTGQAERRLDLVPARSFLRLYAGGEAARRRLLTLSESERAATASFSAEISGTLWIREPVAGAALAWHALRASAAWFVNRGTRELWDRLLGIDKGALGLRSFLGSAARSGQQRWFDYRLQVGRVLHAEDSAVAAQLRSGTALRGSKCLTYGLRSNPWRQLRELRLQDFPVGTRDPVLRLDGRFLARQGVPLLRVVAQENQVVALADFVSFLLCWLRMLVSIHLWSFRAPDPAPPLPPQARARLLPGRVAGLPAPQVNELTVPDPGAPLPVHVRLTRYAMEGAPPVALVHGYSASGNTFTHRAIPEPLARHLWKKGFDVWVLDLRTSAAMVTALQPWRFEDAAFADLPLAIARIRAATGQPVHVFAHCIGAVMLSMALLTDSAQLPLFDRVADRTPARCPDELDALPGNIGRIVLSQKGPLLVYCDDNVLRAYLMRALRKAILPDDYQFHVPAQLSLASNLLDRFLSTLPYPQGEFARENPWVPWRRAPWAGFRHRMDALYARDFRLSHLEDATLHAIEELFGPLNLDTVAQAIHFARTNTITDGAGRPFDTSGGALQRRWPRRGTLSIHGSRNGLVDVATLRVMQSQMEYAGIPYEAREIHGYGHQDCLVGRNAAHDVFPIVSGFL